MSKKIFVILLFVTFSIQSFSQTKEETVSYINNILNLHNNGTMYHSFRLLPNSELSADCTIYLAGTDKTTLKYVFNPKDALYLNTNIRENGVGTVLISFKSKAVKMLGADGKPLEYFDNVSQEGLVSITPTELEKLKKAIKHLFTLLGGQLKDDPF